MSSALDKVKLFPKTFSKNPYLDDSGIPLLVFSSRSNLKLGNISVAPKIIKKVIKNVDLLMASGSDCVSVLVEKKL